MKIAVYSPNWVGDAAQALPFIHELKSQNPEAKIIIVCKDWVESVFLHNPCIDDIVSLSANDVKGVINTISTGISLRKKKIDYFYTLTDSFRSSVIMWLSNAIYRVGYNTQKRAKLLTVSVPFPSIRFHRTNKYLNLIGKEKTQFGQKYIYLKKSEIDWAESLMRKRNINSPIAIFPFSVADSRTFPKDKVKEWLSRSSDQYVVFGSKGDISSAKKIIEQNKGVSVHSFCGDFSLRQSIALISLCRYAIATDSGLGHISSILGVPTISFFGAGVSDITKPIGANSILLNKNVSCSPCNKNICYNYENPLLCIHEITKSDVNYAIKSLHLDS